MAGVGLVVGAVGGAVGDSLISFGRTAVCVPPDTTSRQVLLAARGMGIEIGKFVVELALHDDEIYPNEEEFSFCFCSVGELVSPEHVASKKELWDKIGGVGRPSSLLPALFLRLKWTSQFSNSQVFVPLESGHILRLGCAAVGRRQKLLLGCAPIEDRSRIHPKTNIAFVC